MGKGVNPRAILQISEYDFDNVIGADVQEGIRADTSLPEAAQLSPLVGTEFRSAGTPAARPTLRNSRL